MNALDVRQGEPRVEHRAGVISGRPLQRGTGPGLGPAGFGGLALALVAVVLSAVGGRAAAAVDVDGYGIISALPNLYWAGVGVAGVASVLLLYAADRSRARLAVAVPALWLFVAHTAPALAHAFARFSIVYIHLGFIRLIDNEQTGEILIDARFAWPGFFGSFIPSLTEVDPEVLDWLMRIWPTVILGASAVLVAALARRSYPNMPLIGPLSSLVFVILSWTGQGYFSPQSAGFFFYLSVVIVLESGPLRPRGAWSSVAPILSRFATAGGDRPEARSTASFVSLLILCLGTVVSHPLAPFFICGALAVLGLYGRTVAWRLLVVVGIAYVLWFLVAAEPWWSTRIEELSQQLGSFLDNFQSSTSDRVVSSSPQHLVVTRSRTIVGLITFLSVLAMGVIMATERFRYLRPALPLAPLAGIGVLAAAVQSYGGEIIIRVLLFTLPMASILVARLLLSMPRPVMPFALPVLVVAAMPMFLITRFGNESFEMVTETDRAAVVALYDAADEGTVLIADNAFLPWGDQKRETNDHRYVEASPTNEWRAELEAEAADAGAGRILVVFTPSQSAFRHHVESQTPGSLDQVGRWLAGQPGVESIYSGDGAWVLELEVGS